MKGNIYTKATDKYNEIMMTLGYEHKTIGTEFSENTDGWNMRDMVAEIDYTLSTYYEEGHSNYELKHGDADEKKMWKSHTEKMKRFIKTYGQYINEMICTENHCSKYDNAKREEKQEQEKNVWEFISKNNILYKLTINKNGNISAYTDDTGKKMYWSVTKEMRKFMEPMMAM